MTATKPEDQRGFALCGEPRCGSTFFARALASTGALGRPYELFRTGADARAAERNPQKVLAQAIERASSANGVYGFKVFSNHFDLAEKTSWAERLPRLRFVHIERRDLLGQAISHVRAVQTDQFESRASAGREARYDARAIASALDRIGRNQARWRIWFARNGIEPLRLTYEDIVADPHAAVEAVARLVAVAGYSRAELANTDLQVQRDALSQGWRSRFLVERRDLTRLDSGFSRLGVQLRRWRSTLSLTRHGGKIRPHPGTHEAQGEAKGH